MIILLNRAFQIHLNYVEIVVRSDEQEITLKLNLFSVKFFKNKVDDLI